MKIGLVGLPNVGKSTLFNALPNANVGAENYPFCTVDPNVGVAYVYDERLEALSEMYDTLSKVPAIVEFVDIAGLVKNAGKGEGLGNQFLMHIRNVNAILEVVRCFSDDNIIHVDGSVDPVRDVETINYELIFSDLEVLEKRMKNSEKSYKHGTDAEKLVYPTLVKAKETLLAGKFIDLEDYDKAQQQILEAQDLLTTKKIMFAANVSEEDASQGNEYTEKLQSYLKEFYPRSEMLIVSAKIESELAQLDKEEKEIFLADLGLSRSGLEQVTSCGLKLLDLITYFTAGHKECRAWQITKGTKAPQAAGKIHSDFEKGFIKAEVTKFENLIAAGSEVKAKELAYTRIEGKDYVVIDGDVIYFRFNV